MALKVRRVITGHDANGKAVVKIDEVVGKLKEGRPGAMVAPIWTTEGFPVDNDGQDDAATRQVGTTLAGGTIHNWINKGTAPCVIAFALIDAKPVTAGGKVLNAVG